MFLGPVVAVEHRTKGEEICREAVDAFEHLGDRLGLAYSLINSGEIPRTHGDNKRAAELYERGLVLCRECGDRMGTVFALTNLGMALSADGDCNRAASLLKESIALSETLGFHSLTPHCLVGLAGIATLLGEGVRAGRLLGASERLKEFSGSQFHPADQLYFTRVFSAARELVGGEGLVAEWERGHAYSPGEALAYALSIPAPELDLRRS
jgi:hypothetical protein